MGLRGATQAAEGRGERVRGVSNTRSGLPLAAAVLCTKVQLPRTPGRFAHCACSHNKLATAAAHLQREDACRELRHGVRAARHLHEHALHIRRQLGAARELGADAVGLRLGGQLPGQQQPQQALGQRLAALLGARQLRLGL